METLSTAAIITLRPPFTIPHTFRDDVISSADGTDALIVASPSNMVNVVSALRTMGFNIPEGTSKLLIDSAFPFSYFVTDTITVVGPNASIAPGMTLVRSLSSPIPPAAPTHTKNAVWVYDPAKDRHLGLDDYLGKLASATDGHPYPCRRCGKINRPMYQKDIYTVVKGFEVGIFQGLVRDKSSYLCQSTTNTTISSE
jgi:hypothetical protein